MGIQIHLIMNPVYLILTLHEALFILLWGTQMKAAIYARVSTGNQTTENQLMELKKAAEKHDWDVVEVYEETISGATTKRPQLDALMGAVMRKEIDVVMAWDISRLGRSLQHLVALLGDLQDKSVELYLHQNGVDTTTASGRAMFQMLGVFSQFERDMIRDRIHAGLERAKAQGKRLGRQKWSPKLGQGAKCIFC